MVDNATNPDEAPEFQRSWTAPDQVAEGPSTVSTPTPVVEQPPRSARRPPHRLPTPLRPMTVADLIDGAFVVLKVRPRTVLLIAAVFTLPVQMLAAFLQRGTLSDLNDVSSDPSGFVLADQSETLPVLQSVAIIYLLLLPMPYVGAAIARLVASWYAGSDLTFGEAIRQSMLPWKWLWLFLAWLPIHVLEGLAILAFVLPVIFLMTLFQVVAPVVALENLGPARAAVRSVQLTARRYFPALLIVVLSLVLGWFVTQSLTLIPTLLVTFVPEAYQWVAYGAFQTGAALVITPVLTAISVLLYLDLRIRTEALDIELQATRVFAPAA